MSFLEIKKESNLSISLKTIESLEILQYSANELQTFLFNSLESNPFLEFEPDSKSPLDFLSDFYDNSFACNNGNYDLTLNNLEDRRGPEEYIYEQIIFSIRDKLKLEIALELFELLDDRGFLEDCYLEKMYSLGFEKEQIESTVEILQKMEPTGIFSRNLSECLILQLKEKGIYDEIFQKILHNNFINFIDCKNKRSIAASLGINDFLLDKCIKILKSLTFNPLNSIRSDSFCDMIYPDVVIDRDNSNNELFCRIIFRGLRLNYNFSDSLHFSRNIDKKDSKFIKKKIIEAKWLINNVNKRNETLTKVCQEIISSQAAFFKNSDVSNMQPMSLQEISCRLGKHDSTISRCIRNKYLYYKGKMYPLKYFFCKKIKTSYNSGYDSDSVSGIAVASLIKDIVKKESKKFPYSDIQIATMLKKNGIIVARRTVAKYRKILGVQSFFERSNNYS